MHRQTQAPLWTRWNSLLLAGVAAGCSSQSTTTPASQVPFSNAPCSVTGALAPAVNTTALVDCSNGGSTLTLAGNGASYVVVPQFATNQGPDQFVPYSLASGDLASASISARRVGALPSSPTAAPLVVPGTRPLLWQQHVDQILRARGAASAAAGHFAFAQARFRSPSLIDATPPNVGSVRSFHVLSSFTATSSTFATVNATLSYVGANILLYIDNNAPANGFTMPQLQSFGSYFDQILYGITTTAFGTPSDLDQNGHVIVLMSPVVNALTPASTCATSGYVAGFFDSGDFEGQSNPNSNQGEIFYAIVPDPIGTFSCAHSVTGLGNYLPPTFMHELQHLIAFSQHVVIHGQTSYASWLDEGMSILAEELGSLYFEARCPPPSCRTNASQLFPDSAQGFTQSFLYDSYQYALAPDTASLTLHDDSEDGFSWRGGDWLLVRWLGDQFGSNVFRSLEQGPGDGVADLVAAAGQPFPNLMGNFGLALYTDSLPGLPRATAPASVRFATRNVRQLWARLYVTSNSTSIPTASPVRLYAITTDTAAAILHPGTMSFYRLDTPADVATVTIRFAAPGGSHLNTALHPQLSIYRLPPGQ